MPRFFVKTLIPNAPNALLPTYGLAPPPLPNLPRKFADGRRRRGRERNQIIQRRESLVLYKSFNTFCLYPYKKQQPTMQSKTNRNADTVG